jgi:putative nucleotidyltransferase with HDIG domain
LALAALPTSQIVGAEVPARARSWHYLEQSLGQALLLVDVGTGTVQGAVGENLNVDLTDRLGVLAAVAQGGEVELVEDEAPLALLALPLGRLGWSHQQVAVGVFLYQAPEDPLEVASAARVLGVDTHRVWRWCQGREVVAVPALLRLARTAVENLAIRRELDRTSREKQDAQAHAHDSSMELDLLHQLTGRLHLTDDATGLWELTLDGISDAIAAEGFAIVPIPAASDRNDHPNAPEVSPVFRGNCPLDEHEIRSLISFLARGDRSSPIICNRSDTSRAAWLFPAIRELVAAPISNGGVNLGWILAWNHQGQSADSIAEFGTVEGQLLQSVGTILGVHSSNKRLFLRQGALFASAVQALTSAIDAKDRYTSGHSDRVARVSVRIAQQLGLDATDVEAIYLGGLLHDIGKIGIDDHVLNKPGGLTAEEYEHIKQHPQLGYDILQGVAPLQEILPIVLHHHEAWDGSGYPGGLEGEQTPLIARIVAVADSFDAMSSDRPYRKGMDDKKLDQILRNGAGGQWDARVVEAFFAVRDDIRRIANGETGLGEVPINPGRWVN